MINVITQTTSERNQEMEEKWLSFKDLYYNTNLKVVEIYNKLNVHHSTVAGKYIKQKCREEKMNPARRGKLIQHNKWLK